MFRALSQTPLLDQSQRAYTCRVLSLLALACWIGGLLLLAVSPWLGAALAAAGFVFAGKAVFRRDDMATMFGLMFIVVLAFQAICLVRWLFGELVG